jgi:parallel beta-helix repeat protein
MFFSLIAWPKNYYFSSSTGSDSYTATQAQNPATPWKTIDKLNASMNLINPGDSILFKRGDVFTGKIILTRSGSSAANIAFGAYGTGKLPVIKGTLPVTGWTQYSGNIWVASCPQLDTIVTNFLINGIPQQIGRYPNTDAPNGGYLNIDAHTGRTAISCSSLPSSPNFTGAEAVVRLRLWIFNWMKIKSHQGNSLSFSGYTTYDIEDNFGFFIQNHLNTLDKKGEWYFDAKNKKMYLYYPSDPNLHITEATSCNTLFEASGRLFFSIENIEFSGSNTTILAINKSNNVTLKNNLFSNAGNDGIWLTSCANVSLSNNKIARPNGNALVIRSGRNISIKNNEIRNPGLLPGMGLFSFNQYSGIFMEGNNIQCYSNVIDSTGYNGIYFLGDTIHIKNNYITNFCNILEDGGGIYTWNGDRILHKNRKIESNIILNAVGAMKGGNFTSFSLARGIFLDNASDHVTLINNTIANCAGAGIFFNIYSNNNILSGNTVYNNYEQIDLNFSDPEPLVLNKNLTITNNILFSKTNSQKVAMFVTVNKSDINKLGLMNNNYYCRPVNEDNTITLSYIEGASRISRTINLSTWQKDFNYDLNSCSSPFKLPVYKIIGYTSSNKFANGTFIKNINGWNSWSSYGNGLISWDNSGKLDSGCLKIGFSQLTNNSNSYIAFYSSVGEVTANENYTLKFTMIASTNEKKVRVFMRKADSPYNNIAQGQFVVISQNKQEYELLFTPTTSETNARIDFEVEEDNSNCWIDNVQLYKTNIRQTITEDSIKFFYNPSVKTLSVNDNKYYIDVKGYKYHNFTLQPYTSLILFKVEEDLYNSIPDKRVTSIIISSANGKNNISALGDTMQLITTVKPDYALNKSVTWKMINGTGKATITQNGLVTATSEGNVYAIAIASDGSGVSDTFEIIISLNTMIEAIYVYPAENTLPVIREKQGSLQLKADILPETASDKSVEWMVENITGTALIDETGKITGLSDGIVRVVARAIDGSNVSGQCMVAITNQGTTGLAFNNKNNEPYYILDNNRLLIKPDELSLNIKYYSIYNIQGQCVLSKNITEKPVEIDISSLPSGIYLVALSTNQYSISLKIRIP